MHTQVLAVQSGQACKDVMPLNGTWILVLRHSSLSHLPSHKVPYDGSFCQLVEPLESWRRQTSEDVCWGSFQRSLAEERSPNLNVGDTQSLRLSSTHILSHQWLWTPASFTLLHPYPPHHEEPKTSLSCFCQVASHSMRQIKVFPFDLAMRAGWCSILV